METKHFIAGGVFPVELLAYKVINSFCCKLTKIGLFIYVI